MAFQRKYGKTLIKKAEQFSLQKLLQEQLHKQRIVVSLSAVLSLLQSVPALAQQAPVNAGRPGGNGTNAFVSVPGGRVFYSPSNQSGAAGFGGAKQAPPIIQAYNMSAGQLGQILASGAKTFVLHTNTPIAGDLLIPKGVTLVDFVRHGLDSLTIAGNLSTSGKLLFRPSAGASTANLAANLNAVNVQVNPGGLISSLNNLSLNIVATNNIANAGTISSAANLNLQAGGSITNSLPSGQTGLNGLVPLMQAQNDLSILSTSLTNAGTISALTDNVNIAALTATQSVNINNSNGTIKAAQAINVRDAAYSGAANINIIGGNLLSQELNLYSGKGTIETHVNELSGVVNATACNAHIGAQSGNLILGDLNVSGDPTYYNTFGDVTISKDIITNGEDLAILAYGNIKISGTVANIIDTSAAVGNSGNILMVAGAELTLPAPPVDAQVQDSQTVVIANGKGSGGGSLTGGKITADFPISTLAQPGSLGNGGNVQLVAYEGSNSGSGTITLSGSASVRTGGDTLGANGNVSMIAGANKGSAIDLSSFISVNTTGNTLKGSSGSILLVAAKPIIVGKDISVKDGTPTGGTFNTDGFTSGSISSLVLSTNGAPVQIVSAGNINLGHSISTTSIAPGTTKGGAVALISGADITTQNQAGSVFNIGGSSANVFIVAGANLQSGATLSEVKVTGAGNGGNVDLRTIAGGTPADGAAIATSGTPGGGDVQIYAFPDGSATKGQVLLNQSTAIDATSGSTVNAAGAVTIIAGSNGTSIDTGDIGNWNGSNSSVGLNIISATPSVKSTLLIDNSVLQSGTIAAGFMNGSISLGAIKTSGPINVQANLNLTLKGNVETNLLGPAASSINQINLSAGSAFGILTLSGGKTISAVPSFTGSGGTIAISASNLVVSGTGPATIDASAKSGSGGKITLTQNSSKPSLTIGTQDGNVQLFAAAAGTGDGGDISVSTGAFLFVDPAAVKSSAAGTKSKGAMLSFTASTSGAGNLQVGFAAIPNSGDMNVNGGPEGSAGSLTFSLNSASPMTIGAGAAGSYINGKLSANAGATAPGSSASGGTVKVVNNGSGGIALPDPSTISVVGGQDFNAGSIILESAGGPLTIGKGVLDASSNQGGFNSAFGSVRLVGNPIALPSSGLTIQAAPSFAGQVTIKDLSASTTALGQNTIDTGNLELISINAGFSADKATISSPQSIVLLTKNAIDTAAFKGIPATNQLTLITTGAGSNIGTNALSRLSVDAAKITVRAEDGSAFVNDKSTGDVSGNVLMHFAIVETKFYDSGAKGTFSFVASGVGTGKQLETYSNPLSATDIDITSSGSIKLNDDVNGSNSAALLSAESFIVPSGTVSAPTVILATTGANADIGQKGISFSVNAANFTGSATGSVYVTNGSAGDGNGNVNLQNGSVNGILFSNTAAVGYLHNTTALTGSLVVGNGGVTAPDIELQSVTNISTAGGVTATSTAALISGDSITSVSGLSSKSLILAVLGVASTIGTDAGNGRLFVNAESLTAQANVPLGSVFITNTSSGDSKGNVTLQDGTTFSGLTFSNQAADNFSVNANAIASGKNLNIANDVTGDKVVLRSSGGVTGPGTLIGSTSVAIVSKDSITAAPPINTVHAILVANGPGANIGSSNIALLPISVSSVTADAVGNVWISNSETNGVTLQNASVEGTNYENSAGNEYFINASALSNGKSLDLLGALTAKNAFFNSSSTVQLLGTGKFSNSLSIVSADSIVSGNFTSTITAPNVMLVSTKGSIGVDTNDRVQIDASNLTLKAQNVWVDAVTSSGDSKGNVNLVDGTLPGGFPVTNAATNVGGEFIVSAINLNPGKGIVTKSGVDISAGAGTGDVVLTSSGTVFIGGKIDAARGAVYTGDSITQSTQLGAFASLPNLILGTKVAGASIGTETERVFVSAPLLTAFTDSLSGGSVFITNSASKSVQLIDQTIDQQPVTNNVPATATFSVFASGLTSGQNLELEASSKIDAGTAILSSLGGVQIDGTVIATNAVVRSEDSISSKTLTGTINAPNLTLAALGSGSKIGIDASNRLNVSGVSQLTAQADSDVFIASLAVGDPFALVNSTADGFSYTNTAKNTFSVSAASASEFKTSKGTDISATDLVLKSGGTFDLQGKVTGTTSVTLDAQDNISTLTNVSAPNIVLHSAGGSIGDGPAPESRIIIDNAQNITLMAPSGSVYATSNGKALNIVDATVEKTNYTNTASGTWSLIESNKKSVSVINKVLATEIEIQSGDIKAASTDLIATFISLTASGKLTLSDNKLNTALPMNGGQIKLNVGALEGAIPASKIILDASSAGPISSGGLVEVISVAPLSIGTAAQNLEIKVNAGTNVLDSGDGGLVTVKVTGPGNSLTVDTAAISAAPGQNGGNGAQITLHAAGDLTFNPVPGAVLISADASSAGGHGGRIDLKGGKILGVPAANQFQLSANGVLSGDGGSILVEATDPTSAAIIVDKATPGSFRFSASGGSTDGNGGFVSVKSAGDLTFDSTGVDVSVPSIQGNGGQVIMNSSKTLTLIDATLTYDGVNGDGGVIDFEGATIINPSNLSLSANGDGLGNGGKIRFVTTGNTNVLIGVGGLKVSAVGGGGSGDGGILTVQTGGTLTVDTPFMKLNPSSSNGRGAFIDFSGSSILSADGLTLVLNADGAATGGGGGIILSVGSTVLQTVGTKTSKAGFQLSASAGVTGGGDGGIIRVFTGGSLTVDPAGLKVTAVSPGGLVEASGGTIELSAGMKGIGNLLVTGAINVNSAGTDLGSNGGEIILHSNSKTPFNIGSASATNGTKGPLSAIGVEDKGFISVTNLGGGVINSQLALTAEGISLKSGTNGPVTIANTMIAADFISMNANGTGVVTAAKNIQAKVIDAKSGSGNITLSNVSVIDDVDISANTAGKGVVVVTGTVGKGQTAKNLNILNSSGKTLTFKSIGSLTNSESISGESVLLQATASVKVLPLTPIIVSAPITASIGAVIISAPGKITNTAPITAANGIKITSTGAGADIQVDGALYGGAKSFVTLQSSAGSINTTKDVSSGTNILISAVKGSATVGTIGQAKSTGNLAVTALNDITNEGAINVTGKLSETVTGADKQIVFKANVLASSPTLGVITLNASNTSKGNTPSIGTLAGVDISAGKSVTITTAKGEVSLGSIGNNSPTLQSALVTAFDSVEIAGPLTATKSIKITATSKDAFTGTVTLHDAIDPAISLLTGSVISIDSKTSIGSSQKPLQVVASVGVVANTANGLVNIQNKSTSAVTLQSSSAASAFTFKSAGAIATVGPITAPVTVNLTGTSITVAPGSVVGGPGTLKVFLTATGSGSILSDTSTPGFEGLVQANTEITVKSTSGNIGSFVGFPSALFIDTPSVIAGTTGTVFLQSQGSAPIVFGLDAASKTSKGFFMGSNSTINTPATALTSPSTISLQSLGDININADIGKKGTSSLSLVVSGNGVINNAGKFSLSSNFIGLSTDKSDIGSSGTPFKVNAATSLSVLSNAGSAIVENLGTTAITLSNSTVGGNFTLTSNGSTTLNGEIKTLSGNLIVNSKGTLSTATSAKLTANNGFLTLNNVDTFKGLIVIGEKSEIKTAGGGGGNVSIIIGSTTSTAGTAPTGVKYSLDGKVVTPPLPANTFFFGSKGIKVTNPGQVDMNILGNVKVIFNTGTLPSTAINVKGSSSKTAAHTIIQADPPIDAAVAVPLVIPTSETKSESSSGSQPMFMQDSLASSMNGPQFGTASGAQAVAPLGSQLVSTVANKGPSNETQFGSLGTQSGLTSGSLTASTLASLSSSSIGSQTAMQFGSMNGAIQASSSFQSLLKGASEETGIYAPVLHNASGLRTDSGRVWISETELATGEIPAGICSDTEFGISTDPSLSLELVTNGVHSSGRKEFELKRGSVLFAPTKDATVKTTFGTVKINAGSLVLLMSHSNGLAVYDLDDTHRAAVSVDANGKHYHLYPGMSVVVGSDSIRSFDQINPAQLFCYRDIVPHEIGAGLKVFSSEFFIPMAVKTVLPLKQLVNSKHQNARRVSDHLLKTTAAALHMRSQGSAFHQVIRPATMAYAK